MIEPEMAFADLTDDADLAEDFLTHLCSHALDRMRRGHGSFSTSRSTRG